LLAIILTGIFSCFVKPNYFIGSFLIQSNAFASGYPELASEQFRNIVKDDRFRGDSFDVETPVMKYPYGVRYMDM